MKWGARAWIAIAAVAMLFVGLWWERPSAALIGVGLLLLVDLHLTRKRVPHDPE